MPTTKTVARRYRIPLEMANILAELKAEEAINESAFVRLSIANELAKRGIVVAHNVERGGWRERKQDED